MRMKVGSIALAAVSLVFLGAGCKKPATPVSALENMKKAMVKVEQVAFELTASGSALAQAVPSTGGQAVESMEARMSGHLQRGSQQIANGDGTFSIKTSGKKPMEAMGEYRMVNGVNYARLTKAPVIEGFDLSQFEGQWFSFPSGTDLLNKPEEKTLTNDQIERLEKLFRDTEFFASSTEVGTETLRGQDTTIYEVMLDEERVVSMMEEAARITEEPFNESDRKQVRESVQNWNAKPGRFWIGNADSYLYRVLGYVTGKDKSTATVQMDLFDHNKSVPAVGVPEGAKDFGSLMTGMFGGIFMRGSANPAVPSANMPALPPGMPGLTPEMMKQYQDLQKMYQP